MKIKHSLVFIIIVDDSQCDFQDTAAVGITVFFVGHCLQKFPDQHLGGAFGFISSNVDRIFGFGKWIPFFISFF